MTCQNIKLYFHPQEFVVGTATWVEGLEDSQLQWNFFHLGEFLNALSITPEIYVKALSQFVSDPDQARENSALERKFITKSDLTTDYDIHNMYPKLPMIGNS